MSEHTAPHVEVEEASIASLAAAMREGRLTARRLAEMYLERIQALDASGPRLRSIVESNPGALATGDALDSERAAVRPRGPLRGIPLVLKDNMDTADGMRTTAGSLALLEARPARDAFVVARLRAAGAVLLGKANLSEWANFRSTHSSSGWSGRGGPTRHPYSPGPPPCRSSARSPPAEAGQLVPPRPRAPRPRPSPL